MQLEVLCCVFMRAEPYEIVEKLVELQIKLLTGYHAIAELSEQLSRCSRDSVSDSEEECSTSSERDERERLCAVERLEEEVEAPYHHGATGDDALQEVQENQTPAIRNGVCRVLEVIFGFIIFACLLAAVCRFGR